MATIKIEKIYEEDEVEVVQDQKQAEVSVIETHSKFTATGRGSTAMDEKMVKEQDQAKISVIGTYCKFTATESGSTAMEEKMVKFTICLIRTKQILLAYKEFEELPKNERFIKRIVTEVHDIGEDTNELFEFIDLENDFMKKIMFMWALFEELAIFEDKFTASILLDKLSELSKTDKMKMKLLCSYDQSQLKIIMKHLSLLSGDIDYSSKKRDHKKDMTVKEAFEELSKSINENNEKHYEMIEKVDRKITKIVKSANTQQTSSPAETSIIPTKRARQNTSTSVPAENNAGNIDTWIKSMIAGSTSTASQFLLFPK